eukprot:12897182-Alexandrium_andersonii.AAC.1
MQRSMHGCALSAPPLEAKLAQHQTCLRRRHYLSRSNCSADVELAPVRRVLCVARRARPGPPHTGGQGRGHARRAPTRASRCSM